MTIRTDGRSCDICTENGLECEATDEQLASDAAKIVGEYHPSKALCACGRFSVLWNVEVKLGGIVHSIKECWEEVG
jgi:hypothetical protein